MSSLPQSIPLDVTTARSLPGGTEIVVTDSNGAEVERLTLLRYGGPYRTGAIHAFAVRTPDGKFQVRSDRALGLRASSPNISRAVVVDLREANSEAS